MNKMIVLGKTAFNNKLMRMIWGFIYIIFFRFTPRPFHGYRSIVLRAFGAKIGKGCLIYPDTKIWAPWNLHIRDHATLGEGVYVYNVAPITIGVGAVVSWNVVLCSATHDHKTSFALIAGEISISENSWVAAEAFVGPGVNVGDSAVVGARAVVFKDVGAYEIVTGNPAKVIGKRPVNAKNDLHS